jgi:hypothetical protein
MPEIKTRKQNHENIEKALQCSDLLMSDIRQAHTRACQDDPTLELLLRDLLSDAARMNQRLAQLEGCCR